MKIVHKIYGAEKPTINNKNFVYLWSRFANENHQKEFDDFLDVEVDYDPPEEVFQMLFDL
jgi:hypothetical protein